ITNITGNFLLIPIYGGMGAALATAISYIIFFTLRTIFSIKYYKVDYSLRKIYSMVLLLIIYAIVSINFEVFLFNVFIGLFILLINILLYKIEFQLIISELKKILHKNVKEI